MTEPRCTVGLLTWNAGEAGVACAVSLAAQTEASNIVWVDNASSDETVSLIKTACPRMPAPIVNARNEGFCAGHNQAIAACRTRYYLALNQDIILDPGYVRRLCDAMDAEPDVALASGLILWGATPDPSAPIYSAGLVWPRVGFPFELRMGKAARPEDRRRRRVPGVTGAAMILRVDACRSVSIPAGEIFPAEFFAYHEEVDLALRLARAGLACAVEGEAVAWHVGQGSGGLRRHAIRAGYFTNHWLLPLRHEPWAMMLRESPYAARGELQYWLPRYLANPAAFVAGFGQAMGRIAAARRFYHDFEGQHGPTADEVEEFKRSSLELLRRSLG